ncbi:putative mao-A [Rhizodiscina lignyota]|uniref:Amine oxidase n=1 Tax=Rhizodiscina lignyota TaxID=1504668 RepID=A0A9P4MAH2_9PEZI|nr:putative mao-A [Rhizodiscina lignyota]
MAPRDVHPYTSFVNGTSISDPGWYSHGVSINGAGRLVLTSGQLGQFKDGSFPDTFGGQVKQAIANVVDVLRAAGTSPRDIVQLRFYAVDWTLDAGADLVKPVIALLTEEYGVTYRPLTTLIPVAKLAFPAAKIEVEAVASVGGLSRPWTEADGHLPPGGASAVARPVPSVEVDAIVVGGGFSGLAAAYELQQAGIKTVLLEARHRIGGRSRSQPLKSGPGVIDMGATWINKWTQPAVYALTEKFGLETAEQYTDGDEVFQCIDGQAVRSSDSHQDQASADDVAAKVQQLYATIAEAAEQRDIRKWDDFPQNEDVSVADWMIEKGLYDDAAIRAQCSHLTSAIVGREPHETGAHYFFDYIKSCGGWVSCVTEGEYGAQSLKLKKGTSSIAVALAAAMEPGSVIIHSPVGSITQYGQKSTVTTVTGQTFIAKKVVLAIPTNTYANIRFSPPLPRAKKALVSRTKPGIYAKMVLTYASPWWRHAGLVGKFTSMLGPICFSWETSDEATRQYSLALFIAGRRASEWHALSELAREEAIIEHLATLVGPQLASKARDVLEVNCVEWTKEDFIGGAPTSAMGPGLLNQYGSALREPFGDLHFGGGELAYEWKGYLEGAVTSGQRAASEVIKALASGSKL